MREPIIHDEDPDLEYNIWCAEFLKYKGEFFTGTIFYDDTDPISCTEYKNGMFDGEDVSYHKNGKLAEKRFFKDGEYISGIEWYDNGQLKSYNAHLYDKNGKLIKKDGSWLYPNGVTRDSRENDEHKLFSSKGELAVKTIFKRSRNYRGTVIFFDKVVSECYHELLVNLYPDFEFFYTIEAEIWGWVAKKYSIDKTKGLALIKELEKHPNQNIVSKAVAILELIDKKEFRPRRYIKDLRHKTILK